MKKNGIFFSTCRVREKYGEYVFNLSQYSRVCVSSYTISLLPPLT